MAVSITRAEAEAVMARNAGDEERAARHDALARSARAVAAFYEQREALDAGLMEDRREWERMTEGSRHLAVMADAELRRRDPEIELEPLRSAEPEPAPDELPAVLDDAAVAEHAAKLAARREAFRQEVEARLSVKVPAEDPDYGYEGEAWPAWQKPDRDAVLQTWTRRFRGGLGVGAQVHTGSAGGKGHDVVLV